MHTIRRLIVISAFASPILAHAESSSISIQITGETTPIQTVASILERRFDSVKPGFVSSVSTTAHGNHIALQFSGWAPSSSQIDYLLRTAGRLKISFQGERDSPLVLESDIADSRPLAGREKTELAIRLTDVAARRVEVMTRSNIGREIVVEWEGRVVTRLRIAGPLFRDIALTIPPEYDVLLMSAALRGGRIPDGTTLTWQGSAIPNPSIENTSPGKLGTAQVKTVADTALEFSMVTPERARVEVEENERGRSVIVVYESPDTDDTFSVSAIRANNGGFPGPTAAFFERMMDGASDSMGKKPTVPFRRLSYRGLELHVAQHQGIGAGASQTMTTVVFLQDRGSWRKVIALQLLTRGTKAPSDEFILQRLNALQYRPVA